MSLAPATGPSRSLAAVLCADVCGYSRLMAKNEERTYRRVTRSISLIKSLIGDYGGQVVSVAGDGLIALFQSAPQALDFAVALQQEFRNDTVWNADDEPIAFRIGISLGDVFTSEGNVQGHSINIAARIQALARPGGICVTEAVQRAVRDTLGMRIRPLGRPRLKNIDELVEVFAIELNGSEVHVPPVDLSRQTELLDPPEQASVAVLPLENASGDPRDDHLADGVTRDIISNLCRFRDLLVIASHSSFVFKNVQLGSDEIARHLGVRYLTSGSLERAGSRIRLRMQLVEARSGRILWTERYDGDLAEIFAFQDDVTDVVASRLATEISAAERRLAQAQEAPDLRAYGLILRGHELSTRFQREANLHARRLFEFASEIDPGYGRSYAGLSRTFNLAWRYRWTERPEASLDRAVELAKEAIQYDRLDARGYGELGFASLYRKEHDASLAAYERAVKLNPNDADILAEMGDAVSYAGDHRRAIQMIERAIRLNPYHPDWYHWYLGEAHFHLGDFEKTIETLKKMHDQSEAHRLLAASHAHLGDMAKARQHAQEVLRVHPDFSIEHWRMVPPYRDPDHLEVLIEGLRKAGLR